MISRTGDECKVTTGQDVAEMEIQNEFLGRVEEVTQLDILRNEDVRQQAMRDNKVQY